MGTGLWPVPHTSFHSPASTLAGEITFNTHFPRFKLFFSSSFRPHVPQHWEMAEWLQISLGKLDRKPMPHKLNCGLSREREQEQAEEGEEGRVEEREKRKWGGRCSSDFLDFKNLSHF